MKELWSRVARDKADTKERDRLFAKGRQGRARARRAILRIIHVAIKHLPYGSIDQGLLTLIIYNSTYVQWKPYDSRNGEATVNCRLRHRAMWTKQPAVNTAIYAVCGICKRIWMADAESYRDDWRCLGRQ